jgi:hypothetical protein
MSSNFQDVFFGQFKAFFGLEHVPENECHEKMINESCLFCCGEKEGLYGIFAFALCNLK